MCGSGNSLTVKSKCFSSGVIITELLGLQQRISSPFRFLCPLVTNRGQRDKQTNCLSSLTREAFQEGPLSTAEKSTACCNSAVSIRVAFCQVSTLSTGSFSVCLASLVVSVAARALVRGTVQLCFSMSGYNVPNPGYGGHFGESIKVRREGGSKWGNK